MLPKALPPLRLLPLEKGLIQSVPALRSSAPALRLGAVLVLGTEDDGICQPLLSNHREQEPRSPGVSFLWLP